MSNEFEFDKVQTVPTLSFDIPDTKQEISITPEAEKPAEVPEEDILTPEEKKMVDEFVDKIDLHNSGAILQYGVSTQKKLADFSQDTLENVKTKDLGEVGDMLSSVVMELKSFDAEEDGKGFLGIFKKSSNRLQALKTKYDDAEKNVDKITKALEQHQITLMKDVALLDRMYDLNLTYYKELTMYIMAGKKKLQQVLDTELPELTAKAQKSGLPEDAQAVKDLESMCNRFEKKLHDLELTRMIAMQTAPQLRLVQNSDTMMVEKIQSTIVNTIPLWKSQMVIALGVAHSTQAAKAQQQVADMTNELLKKNAENLKTSTIETAKASERGIVDLETLKNTNESLISTLDEVMKIQMEGREKRQAAELELREMEKQMRDKLLEVRR